VQYRPLGRSGIEVSVLGFGAWGIGGRTSGATSYGDTDDDVSRRALNEAFEHGVSFYDTASVYGNGHSEELIGECFKSRRHRVVIASKAGIRSSFDGYDFSANALRRSLEASLRRLRTDYLDVLQLHNASADTVRSQTHLGDLLNRFVDEGKVRAFGFSTPSPQDAIKLLDFPNAACFQVNCNLLDWRAIDCGLFDKAKDRGIGIIARTPLAFGFLSGRFDKDAIFPAEDHRSRWPRERIGSWIEAADAIFANLGPPDGERRHRAATALRFCLSFDAVASVIPGMLTPEEVLANITAANAGALGGDQLRNIERTYRQYQMRLDIEL
jgi:aryl-alcohol dehydrogenase-like predicted oxidoreductase